MKTFLIFFSVLICVLIADAFLYANNYADNKAVFYDSQSGLYWYDPGVFAGWSTDEMDIFINENLQWKWRDADPVVELYMDGFKSEPLSGIMGSGTYFPGSLCGWDGCIDPEDTHAGGVLGCDSVFGFVELYTTLKDNQEGSELIAMPVISGTVFQGIWLYAEDDQVNYTAPVPEPSTIFLIGTGLIGFAGILRKLGRDHRA